MQIFAVLDWATISQRKLIGETFFERLWWIKKNLLLLNIWLKINMLYSRFDAKAWEYFHVACEYILVPASEVLETVRLALAWNYSQCIFCMNLNLKTKFVLGLPSDLQRVFVSEKHLRKCDFPPWSICTVKFQNTCMAGEFLTVSGQ